MSETGGIDRLKSIPVTAELHEYMLDRGSPPDEILRDLIDATYALGGAGRMQIDPAQGPLLTLLTRLVGAEFAVEVGTFTGYSAICIARGLAPGGRLLCCDVNPQWTAIAREHWERAGLADRIDLRLAPALETLRSLPDEPLVDLAFIDADKPGYVAYWDELVPRVRRGGLVVADNVLWDGDVADASVHGEAIDAVRAFNDRVAGDDRVEAVILPIADGLTIAQVR
jgi:caffeoyl-CoA O-methyltransferase